MSETVACISKRFDDRTDGVSVDKTTTCEYGDGATLGVSAGDGTEQTVKQ